MNVIYFCPSEGLYGDNIALMRIMPHLKNIGINPLFIVAFEGEMVNYLKSHNYNYIISNCNCWNMYNLDRPLRNYIIGLLWRVKHFWGNIKQVNRIAKDVRYFKADLVHSNSSNSSFGYFLAKKLKIKHVWHLREYGRSDSNKQFFPSFQSFIRRLNSNNNFTISITPLIYNYFKRDRNKDIIIYDGVFDKNNIPNIDYNKEKYFLYVGRLFYKKGVESIINAFSKIHRIDSEYKLLLAGDGDHQYVCHLKHEVQKLGCKNSILFLGYRSDVKELMKKSKSIIVASTFEGFGFITAEAMFAGCYVIGRDTAGTKLQFDNIEKICGTHVCSRFNNQKELEQAMIDIMTHKIDETKHLKIVQKNVANLYDIKKTADSVSNFYKIVLK